tara:strand:- start:18 stop:524 length:507 start_codon:yes stop_codon:yes gene_type:complete
MRYKSIFLLIFLIIYNSNAFSNERIAFVDIDFLFLNSNLGKNISSKLEKINKKNQELIETKTSTLKKIENEINKTKNVLSKEELNKKISLLKEDVENYNKEKNEIVKEFEKLRNSELQKFFDKINPVLQDYMNQESISLLLEKKNIFIGKAKTDITNDVLKIINTKFN